MSVLKWISNKKKVIFIQLLEYPIPPYCCCSVTNWSEKHKKCIFETTYNVLRTKESNVNAKNGSKFSLLPTVRYKVIYDLKELVKILICKLLRYMCF